MQFLFPASANRGEGNSSIRIQRGFPGESAIRKRLYYADTQTPGSRIARSIRSIPMGWGGIIFGVYRAIFQPWSPSWARIVTLAICCTTKAY